MVFNSAMVLLNENLIINLKYIKIYITRSIINLDTLKRRAVMNTGYLTLLHNLTNLGYPPQGCD